MSKHECDREAVFSHPGYVEACQMNYHGQVNPEIVKLRNELRIEKNKNEELAREKAQLFAELYKRPQP